MNERFAIGFIGFGEAGFEIARGLRSAGVTRMCLCDIRTHDPEKAALVVRRAEEAGVSILDSTGAVAEQAEVVLSLVAPEASVTVALEAAGHLRADQFYIDLTSAFPEEMKTIGALLEPKGVKFVDGAMMGAVPVHGHRVLIYTAGLHAEEAAGVLNRYGMNLQTVGTEYGQASAIKLTLSVATKGLESLLVEMLLAAHHYHAEEPVLLAMNQFFAKGLDAVVDRFVASNAVHAGRRVKEMQSAARFLEKTGIEPIMTTATIERLRWTAALKLDEYFGGVTPGSYRDVIQAWDKIGVFDKDSQ